MVFRQNHGTARARKYARVRELPWRGSVRPERFPRGKRNRRKEKARENERKRGEGGGEKFILKWALPNGAARRTLEPTRPGSDELRSWPVARESRKGPEAARMNKKAVRERIYHRDTCQGTAVCERVYVHTCTAAWMGTVALARVCARRSYTRLFENHFKQTDEGRESILGTRRHATTTTSRYHCSAASKLRRVHRLYTLCGAST